MTTHTQIAYHIVFSTKHRQNVLTSVNRDKLFRYIWGIINNNKGHLYRINGVEDHIHILSSLHPSLCLADFVRNIKRNSSRWINENRIFPSFTSWQNGYSALTHSYENLNRIIEYIKDQEKHHQKMSFREEYIQMLKKAGIEIDDKYLF